MIHIKCYVVSSVYMSFWYFIHRIPSHPHRIIMICFTYISRACTAANPGFITFISCSLNSVVIPVPVPVVVPVTSWFDDGHGIICDHATWYIPKVYVWDMLMLVYIVLLIMLMYVLLRVMWILEWDDVGIGYNRWRELKVLHRWLRSDEAVLTMRMRMRMTRVLELFEIRWCWADGSDT